MEDPELREETGSRRDLQEAQGKEGSEDGEEDESGWRERETEK